MKIFLAVLLFLSSTGVWANEAPDYDKPRESGLFNLDLDNLMNIEVTSVAKKEQKLFEVASAVHVINREDIARTGLNNVPELLRLVPGMHVAHINGHKWAINARGYNNIYANKLLVLVDGRTVYTPLFGGTYWNEQDLLLEDIERIEVIRGPGATLWGANAVSGVVNVITKHTKDTQQNFAMAGTGTEERGFIGGRVGGKKNDTSYRAYIKYFNRDDSSDLSRDPHSDAWDMARAGFRLDHEPEAGRDSLMVNGEVHSGKGHQIINIPNPSLTAIVNPREPIHFFGAHLLTQWKRILSNTSDWTLQTYLDHIDRDESKLLIDDRQTFDVEFRHRFTPTQLQEITWGMGYRYVTDQLKNTVRYTFSPKHRTQHVISAFIQDEISLLSDKTLKFIVGTKVEHNDYSGLEFQPSARLLWLLNTSNSLWASVSRAIRVPTRGDHDTVLNAVGVTASGNEKFGEEKLISYELGHRFSAYGQLFVDTTLFFFDFDDMTTYEFDGVSDFPLDNKKFAEHYGIETSATWQAADNWRIKASYSFADSQVHTQSNSADPFKEWEEYTSPEQQVRLNAYIDLPHDMSLNPALYYVDRLPTASDLPAVEIKPYLRADVSLGWKPSTKLDFSLVLQNLLDPQHPEVGNTDDVLRSQIDRAIYAKVTWNLE